MSLKEKNACLGPVSSFVSFNKSLSSWVSNKLMVQAKLFLEFLLPPKILLSNLQVIHSRPLAYLGWALKFCEHSAILEEVQRSWTLQHLRQGRPKLAWPTKIHPREGNKIVVIPSTIYFARHPKSPLYTWSHLIFANKPRVLKNSVFSDKKTKLLMSFCLTLSTHWF